MQTMTPHDAIGQAIAEEMRRDPSVLMFGEGVATKRHELVAEFGAERVRNTPLAEAIIAGTAAGDAPMGRPVGVPAGERVWPVGKAAVRCEGRGVTLVSYAKTVGHCLQAAQALEADGVSAEVVDLRTLKPIDEATVLASVRKTGRLIVVHEANRLCGVGAEIAAIASEKAFDALTAPVLRL